MFKIETVSHLDMTETIVDKTVCDQTLPWVGLRCVTVVFQDHTCLISYMGFRGGGGGGSCSLIPMETSSKIISNDSYLQMNKTHNTEIYLFQYIKMIIISVTV